MTARRRASRPGAGAPDARQEGPSGTLFVAATPIGHLGDVSPRLAATLAAASLVLCEDTRRTGVLLAHLGVSAALLTCHDHDEQRRIPEVLARLAAGENVVLVTDAGTPCISDPGYRLVKAAHEAGLRVSPIPGPSSVTAALSACGLPTDAFAFEGFLPRKRAARRRLLAALADEPRTLVFLEAPHRAAESAADLADAFGETRPACLARELTKVHEEVLRAPLAEIARRLASEEPRGEVVLVVGGASARGDLDASGLAGRVAALVAQGTPEREALKQAARDAGMTRREAYRRLKVEARDESE